ncbi:2-oxoglutarate (2OG) and Fe(II)-dependent oxygenase superfamily protein [Actinidia rufa]|uniref:2-oxoglutarate (2OG) and Fe(II)-dependent oxygenase superfamily protein n=1 Tax=Actinidia rufa TaxID=165716 RepID=A0A7J0FCY5_9ERIC|nr:2-oxoglutarate (2OG) and Fe(II)-dependent oxygenase superfamily protein [Actinidia rufa]
MSMAIPVIDFSKLDGVERAKAMAHIANGCEEWGFFQVLVKFGEPWDMSEELLEKVKKVCSECYKLEREESFKNSKKVKMLNDLVEKKIDHKLENVDWEDVFLLSDEHEWPSKTPGFKETMVEYRSELKKLAEKVMEVMDENLGLPKGYIQKAFNGEDGEQNAFFGTKVSHYPPCPHPEAVTGLRAHTDAGGVILLFQDDKIEVFSNGRYKSVWHRVFVTPDGNRRSVASFYNPSLKATLAPAPELVEKVNQEEDKAYPKFVFGDYMSVYAEQKFLPKEPSCQGIFCVRQNPKQLNHAVIALVPKTASASRVEEFRPIACCNVIYKVISKILAARLSPILESLIDPGQSAFVPNRSMVENIYMVQELLRKYCWNRISPRCIMKVDLRKAYDTVNWNFLEDVLSGLGFPALFIQWIMQCVSTTSYSISINGSLHGFFKGKQGLGISNTKSNIFMAGISRDIMEEIKTITGFSSGRFPFRYLISDYVSAWAGATLSYAGRSELIRSVLQGVECFWLSILPIPVGVRDKVISLCKTSFESLNHLFFQCPVANQVWVEIKSWLGFSRALTTLKAAAKWIIKEARGTGVQAVAKKVGFACTVYYIWATRNARMFEGKIVHPTGIIRDIKIQVYRVLHASFPNLREL